MKNIVVTGGLGFIGSNLIELLIKQNYKVINIDKVTYSSNFYNVKNYSKNKKYKIIKSDLNNKKKLSGVTWNQTTRGLSFESIENIIGYQQGHPVSCFKAGASNMRKYH